MILNVNILKSNKLLDKGRGQAVELLADLSKRFNLPLPRYAYKEKPLPVTAKSTKKGKGGDNNNSKKFFVCEASAPIPSPIYQQKLVREKRQQKQGLQSQHHAVNDRTRHDANSNSGEHATPQGRPLNLKSKTGEQFIVPLTFPIPTHSEKNGGYTNIFGAGECDSRNAARNLAALEVVYQMEQIFNVPRGELPSHLRNNSDKLIDITELYHDIPYHEEIPGITWHNIPIDSSFAAFHEPPPQFQPATRKGNIDFLTQIMTNEHARLAAKSITLASSERLPIVNVHSNVMKYGSIQRFANVQPVGGPLEGVVGTLPGGEMNIGLDSIDAVVASLTHLYDKMTHEPTQKGMKKDVKYRYRAMVAAILKETDTSYGMAKLFVHLPKHQFQDLSQLIESIPVYSLPQSHSNTFRRKPPQRRLLQNSSSRDGKINSEHQERIATFRRHQQLHPLPVDSIEGDIPHDVSVTIVRGGTGSGKVRSFV